MRYRRVAQNLYRLGLVYYAIWKEAGRKRERSLRTRHRSIANQRLRDLLDSIPRTRSSDRSDWTLRQFANVWIQSVLPTLDLKPASRRFREYAVAGLLHSFPGADTRPVRLLHLTDCEAWQRQRRPQVSAQWYNHELASLRLLLDFAQRERVLPDNPARQLRRAKITQPHLVIPTRDQFAALIPVMRRIYYDSANLAELLAYSGMRVHEAASLRWADIDWTRQQFHVTGGATGTKNRRTRWVPLFPALRRLLARMPRRDDDLPVSTVATCRHSLRRACRELGLPEFTHHSLRHFFASNAIEEGVDYLTIAHWLGHSDGGVLLARVYGHLRETHAHQSAKRMKFSAPAGGE